MDHGMLRRKDDYGPLRAFIFMYFSFIDTQNYQLLFIAGYNSINLFVYEFYKLTLGINGCCKKKLYYPLFTEIM